MSEHIYRRDIPGPRVPDAPPHRVEVRMARDAGVVLVVLVIFRPGTCGEDWSEIIVAAWPSYRRDEAITWAAREDFGPLDGAIVEGVYVGAEPPV
ncbi:MAG: hypothetical protein JNM50_12805 [Chromatiales bacterium]|nr:hypothetical protein [Chromatiales bacterium]